MNGRGNNIKVPRGFYTTAQVARIVGRDPDTVKRWRKVGALKPARTMKAGRLSIPLFDSAGLRKAKQLADPSRRNLEDRIPEAA
jgi:hypothetical protein